MDSTDSVKTSSSFLFDMNHVQTENDTRTVKHCGTGMAAKSKTTGKDHGDSDERLADLLVEILDHCDAWMEDDGGCPPSWRQIATSLKTLACTLEQFDKDQGEASYALPEQHLLLKIEEEIQDIRSYANQVKQEIDDISGTLGLCRTLSTLCRESTDGRISTLSASLPTAVRNQRLDIFDTLQSVDVSLDGIYDCIRSGRSDSVRTVSLALRKASQNLHHKCIKSNQGVWKIAKDILKRLLGGEEAVSFERGEVFKAGKRLHTNEPCPSALPVGSVLSNNVLNAADLFASSSPGSELEKCILLVGPTGSGKTYCLDQIQRLASSTLCGKNFLATKRAGPFVQYSNLTRYR